MNGDNEWCMGCKEYDVKRHCCPRWNKVIRNTVEELKLERPKDKWEWVSSTFDRTPCEMRLRCSNCHHEIITHGQKTVAKVLPELWSRHEGGHMTREEAIKKHRELWHWIANEHRRRKSVRVQKFENPEVAEKVPKNDCWLCEYVKHLEKDFPRSECDCPIKWGENIKFCSSIGSPYLKWSNRYGSNYEDLAKLADIIAELPEKENT